MEQLHILDALKGIQPWLLERSIQIFCRDPNSKSLYHEGSGFLVSIYGLKLMITAGHVVMDGRHQPLFYPRLKSEGLEQLTGIGFPSSSSNDNLGLDPLDFFYLILDNESYQALRFYGYKFITKENINFDHRPNSNTIYTAVGCPVRKTKKKGIDTFSVTEFISNFGLPTNEYPKDLSADKNVLLRLNRKLLHEKTRQKVFSGNLVGMSGGPLWHTGLKYDYNSLKPSIQLIGILTSYKSNHYISSTNIKLLKTILSDRNYHIAQKPEYV